MKRLLYIKYEPREHDDEDHHQALKQTGFWGRKGVGCLFLARDSKRILVAHRSVHVLQPGTWGTWGGAVDGAEELEDALRREIAEETGYRGDMEFLPLYIFKDPSGFEYHNYLAIVESEFEPEINPEIQGYEWVEFGKWPRPLHPGMIALFSDKDALKIMKEYSFVHARLGELLEEQGYSPFMGDCMFVAAALQKIMDPTKSHTAILCVKRNTHDDRIRHCFLRDFSDNFYYDAAGPHEPVEVRDILNDYNVDEECLPDEDGDFEDEFCVHDLSHDSGWFKSDQSRIQQIELVIRKNAPAWLIEKAGFEVAPRIKVLPASQEIPAGETFYHGTTWGASEGGWFSVFSVVYSDFEVLWLTKEERVASWFAERSSGNTGVAVPVVLKVKNRNKYRMLDLGASMFFIDDGNVSLAEFLQEFDDPREIYDYIPQDKNGFHGVISIGSTNLDRFYKDFAFFNPDGLQITEVKNLAPTSELFETEGDGWVEMDGFDPVYFFSLNYNHDLSELKISTDELIQYSIKEGLTGDSDLIDEEIIDHIQKINQNPYLVPTGSCSGHDGTPFIGVVFKNDRIRDFYILKMKKQGFLCIRSSDFRMKFFSSNFKTKIHDEISFGLEEASSTESKEVWSTFVKILARKPPANIRKKKHGIWLG